MSRLTRLRGNWLVALIAVLVGGTGVALAARTGVIGPKLGILNNGRHLEPYGRMTRVGNLPTGGALTPDGRFYWTVATGSGFNDVRIVSVRTAKVIQILPMPGASGGIVADPRGGRVYVSGLANSTNAVTSRPNLPGAAGDAIHVFSYSRSSGRAHELKPILVPPPAFAKPPQDFPVQGSKLVSYPERLAISRDGRTLLVPLGLAASAAIVDVRTGRARYVATGDYPYGATILPDGRRGLVSNEAPGTVSVIDLRTGRKVKDIVTGGHLAHPEAIVSSSGARAYVAVADRDRVAVIDTRGLRLERYLNVGNPAGIGTSPVALALTPHSHQLLVAEAGSDEISVFAVPHGRSQRFTLQGRIPIARYPTDVQSTAGRHPKLLWTAAKGLGIGPDRNGPDPFHSLTLGQSTRLRPFLPYSTDGTVGVAAFPSAHALIALTRQATAQVVPANHVAVPPAGTPLRAGGPIKHVFFIVKENRTYDQVLGDDRRGDGAPKLTLFGQRITPNLHALVRRFPLLDHFYADSEASIQGHQWTAAGNINHFSETNWNQISSIFGSYGARARPLEPGFLAVSWPKSGYLFDQAMRQGISFFNYGEIFAGDTPLPNPKVAILAHTLDADRTARDQQAATAKYNRSDLGPGANGCYPADAYASTNDILTGKQIFDSALPAGAPAGAESRVDCFRKHFAQQAAGGTVPAFSYITLPNDHTQGLRAGARTPQADIADNDAATAQILDTISHSKIWASSAIFVVEDDSQDGADHVDAHRTVAAVISPYAKRGAVVHDRYDQLSMIRSIELILGMRPLSLNDALATPMYNAFQSRPTNIAPFSALRENQNLLATNPSGTLGARLSAQQDFAAIDAVPQHSLDNLLWMSVHGPRSKPPPPGPGATQGHDAG